jgi:hypothetical protein
MSKRTFLSNQPAGLVALGIILSLVFFVGFALAGTTLVRTTIAGDLWGQPICFKNDCIEHYFATVSQSFAIAKATIDVGVAIATIGGIFVALLSYINTSGNAALTNHIEHLKIFSEYLDSEIKKRDRLSSHLIDTLLLYGKIFSQSRSGKTTVSLEYYEFIANLNKLIQESNDRCVVGTPGGFSYRDHQKRIQAHVAKVGIKTYFAPRNDYFEMEGQLFSLLHRLSQSFCAPGSLPNILDRRYH